MATAPTARIKDNNFIDILRMKKSLFIFKNHIAVYIIPQTKKISKRYAPLKNEWPCFSAE